MPECCQFCGGPHVLLLWVNELQEAGTPSKENFTTDDIWLALFLRNVCDLGMKQNTPELEKYLPKAGRWAAIPEFGGSSQSNSIALSYESAVQHS